MKSALNSPPPPKVFAMQSALEFFVFGQKPYKILAKKNLKIGCKTLL
jgi:hypothetical protein